MQASTSEKIITYSALFISVTALVLSLVEVNNMRDQTRLLQEQTELLVDQNKAAVWPNLSIFFFTEVVPSFTNNPGLALGTPVFCVGMANSGIGPARVEDVYLWVDGTPITTIDALRTALGLESSAQASLIARVNNITYIPGFRQTFFLTEDANFRQKLIEAKGRIEMAACYRSVFDDWWYTKRVLTPSSYIKHQACDSCPWPSSQALRLQEEYFRN